MQGDNSGNGSITDVVKREEKNIPNFTHLFWLHATFAMYLLFSHIVVIKVYTKQ